MIRMTRLESDEGCFPRNGLDVQTRNLTIWLARYLGVV